MVGQADETTVQDGAPIELYLFTGTYNTYRLTNSDVDVTSDLSGSITAAAFDSSFAVSRGKVEEGTQEDSGSINLDIELDLSHPMVAEYAINQPPPALRLQLYRAHRSDPNDTFLLWDGEVISWSITGRTARMRVPPLLGFVFDSPIPRPKYQAPCNHVLGDARCGVDLTTAANSHTTTIATINGTAITLDTNTIADGELVAGQIEAPGERRMVVSNTGTSLLIATPFSSGVNVGDAVTVRRGCDHALTGDCINRFNNSINFGGFPLVPTRSPFGGRI